MTFDQAARRVAAVTAKKFFTILLPGTATLESHCITFSCLCTKDVKIQTARIIIFTEKEEHTFVTSGPIMKLLGTGH